MTMNDYLELSIEVSPLYSELVAEILSSFGFNEVILSDINYSKGNINFTATHVKAYIPQIKDYISTIDSIKAELKRNYTLLKESNINESKLGSWQISITPVHNEDWAENWKRFWHPQKIGDHIIISPSWEKDIEQGPDDQVIFIDPGAAFGTGTHQTTRLCIKAIEKIFKTKQNIKTVMDIGTGSGILAITAAKMGAEKVVANDIDPLAIQIAKENSNINNCQNKCFFSDSSIKQFTEEYDLVIVNILAKTIIALSEHIKRLTKKGGFIILSGIITEKLEEVQEHFHQSGFKIIEINEEEGWYSITGQKE
jgi:ribosomal protein L11 methyltransferase